MEQEAGAWEFAAAELPAGVQIGERGREKRVGHHTSGAPGRERWEFVPA